MQVFKVWQSGESATVVTVSSLMWSCAFLFLILDLPDPLNALVIKEAEGLQDICECLKSENAEVVVNALTALYYLCGTIPADVMKVVSSVDLSSLCSSRNPCISNMANLLCNEAKGIKPPRPRP
eukprot:Rmarinus@m.29793